MAGSYGQTLGRRYAARVVPGIAEELSRPDYGRIQVQQGPILVPVAQRTTARTTTTGDKTTGRKKGSSADPAVTQAPSTAISLCDALIARLEADEARRKRKMSDSGKTTAGSSKAAGGGVDTRPRATSTGGAAAQGPSKRRRRHTSTEVACSSASGVATIVLSDSDDTSAL